MTLWADEERPHQPMLVTMLLHLRGLMTLLLVVY